MIGVDWRDQTVVTVAHKRSWGRWELRTFTQGTAVQFKSLCSSYMFQGQIIGFLKSGEHAVCTDQSGLPPRAVRVTRLQRAPRQAGAQ